MRNRISLPPPAPGDNVPPVERAVREAALELALETGDSGAAGALARDLLEALRSVAARAKPGEGEAAAAMFLLLSRRVCETLCDGEARGEKEGSN